VFAINLSSASPIDSSKVNTHSNEKTIEESASLELTAEDVIEKYLEAIGGRKQIESMADRSTTMSGTTMGKTLGIVVKQKAPSMLRQEINTGTIKQTIIFDGEKGVMLMGEQKSELGGNELDKLKIEAQMNFLLNPESFGVRPDLIGIEIIDSVQCYNISMNMDDSFEQESLFSDYREVDGLKFPFKITQTLGAQTIELNIEMIEINTGLQDVLFEIPE
jgi:outer membrane lipoprotein-sorting protein